MARRDQLDKFMVGGSRGPSASRPDPNAGRRPGDPFIIAQDSRPVGIEGLNEAETQQYVDFLNTSDLGFRGAKTPGISDRQRSKLGRMAFDQFRNLQSGGDYAPALREGMSVPGGTIARNPREGGGLASFLTGGGILGGILESIGGQAPRGIMRDDGVSNMTAGYVPATQQGRRPAATTRSDEELLNMMLTRDVAPTATAPAASAPIREIGGSFDVAPMEAIANPGGQAFPDPAADMVDMSGMLDNNSPLGNPNVNVSNLLDLRERNQQTTAILDDAINAVGRVNPDEQRSPSSARKIEQDLLDAILAREIENREAQARDRSAQNIQNLVAALPPRPPVYTPELENQFTEQMLDMMPSMQEIRYMINDTEIKRLEEAERQAARQAEARRMSEINNPPGDPLDLFMENDVGQMLSDLEMSLRRGNSQPR
jgi:hypothetical protein